MPLRYHPEADTHVFADEPYETAPGQREAAREAWARARWAGMYWPGQTTLYLFSAASGTGFDLAKAVAALDQLPPPIDEASWSGRTVEFRQAIVTPAGKLPRPTPKPALPRKTPIRRGPTETYFSRSNGLERHKPRATMPIELHGQVGWLLSSVLWMDVPSWRLHDRIDRIRAVLNDWAQLDHDGSEIEAAAIDALYHGGSEGTLLADPDHFDARVAGERPDLGRATLQQQYRDCKPLRSILADIDDVVAKVHRVAAARPGGALPTRRLDVDGGGTGASAMLPYQPETPPAG